MKSRSFATSLPTKWPSFACHFASTSVKEVLFDRIPLHPQRRAVKNKKMVKNMKNEMKNENRDNVAAIGIGAMIVFIALILWHGLFSNGVIGLFV